MSRVTLATLAGAVLLAGCATTPPPPTSAAPSRTPILLGPTSTASSSLLPSRVPPPGATSTPAPLPPITGDDWSLGPADAPIEFLVYTDFQAPNAAFGLQSLFETIDRHPDDIRLVLRHFPVLPEYDKDSLAGQAVEAAGRQGFFWAMARLLAERHREWSVLPPDGFVEWLTEQAPSIGLDLGLFQEDLNAGRYAALMVDSFQEASELGVPGVPTILMNGIPLRFAPTALQLESAVRLDLLSRRAYPGRPPRTIDVSAGYTAFLELAAGEIVIQLFPESAPEAVNSFVFLAGEGWLNRTTFFAVQPGVQVEAGDPSETGLGDPGYHLPDEIDPSLSFDSAGMVALSSAGPGTGGSRFFITLEPLPSLNGTRTIFGRVVEGLEILNGLAARDPATDLLTSGAAVIRRVRIERTG